MVKAPQRRAGEPIAPELRVQIVAKLRAGEPVSKIAETTGVTQQTIRRIRIKENIPGRKPGVTLSRVSAETEASILAALRSPDRAGDEAIADAHGVGRSVVKRIRMAAGIPVKATSKPRPLDASDETRERIARDDEVKRLRSEIKRLHREALNDAAIKELLGRVRATPAEPPAWLVTPPKPGKKSTEVPVTIWSDWHVGEVVSRSETAGINEYSPEIAERRIRSLVTNTIHLCRDHHAAIYPGVVVNLLGDFVSGGLHPELAKTDAEEVIPSALRCRDLLIWGLEQLAAVFGRVYAPCAAGNHGRQTQKPEYKQYVYKNFDWMIYQLLARHFEGRKDIVVDVPDANEVHYRVLGQRYFAMHGDQLGVKGGDGIISSLGPIARGEVKVGKQAAALSRDYDVLLMGHWHQSFWLPRVIVAGSLKGWDEYSKNALRAAPQAPSQPLWFVNQKWGITSRWDVRVEAPEKKSDSSWVSVFSKED